MVLAPACIQELGIIPSKAVLLEQCQLERAFDVPPPPGKLVDFVQQLLQPSVVHIVVRPRAAHARLELFLEFHFKVALQRQQVGAA